MFLDAHELEGVVDPATTRPCPKCQAPMRAEEINGVPTNSCRGCGGRWLEVPMIEHMGELSGEARLTRDALIRTFVSLNDADTRETAQTRLESLELLAASAATTAATATASTGTRTCKSI